MPVLAGSTWQLAEALPTYTRNVFMSSCVNYDMYYELCNTTAQLNRRKGRAKVVVRNHGEGKAWAHFPLGKTMLYH